MTQRKYVAYTNRDPERFENEKPGSFVFEPGVVRYAFVVDGYWMVRVTVAE